jgi:methylenetetrahydrofolate--tRNA-(uracil-5-)-methyltransferase
VLFGSEYLYFYDAISPVITAESINTEVAFRASRYDHGGDDYLNCPLTRDEYYRWLTKSSQLKRCRKKTSSAAFILRAAFQLKR